MDLTVLAFLVILSPIILMHEIGHFIGAKLTGVRVEEFGLGWPPRLLKLWQSPSRLRIGETSVVTPRNPNLPAHLQIGQPVEATVRPEPRDGAYLLERLRLLDPKRDETTPGQWPADGQLLIRGPLTEVDMGTAYTLNVIPAGGFCRMTGEEDPSDPRSLAAQPKRERLVVLMGGPVVNLLLSILLFAAAFVSGVPEPLDSYVVIREVAPDSPAQAAGLRSGDIVLEASGIPISTTDDLIEVIDAHAGQSIRLTLQRGEEVVERAVQVRAQRHSDGRVGIVISNDAHTFALRHYSWPQAFVKGVDQFLYSTQQMLSLPVLLIRGQISAQEVQPVGPVGISQIAGKAIERSNQEQSWFTVLFFAGAISMALGVTNLLPLPALDGGRILFVLIEAVRGRRVDPAKEGLVHLVGVALLLGLVLLMTLKELLNPVTSPF